MAITACADQNPAGLGESSPANVPPPALVELRCRTDVLAETLSCGPAAPETPPGVSPVIIGGQGTNVRLVSSGTSYDATTGILRTDVTIENLMSQALGTTDGAFPAPEGVRVFFFAGPTVTEGTGTVTVANADGEGVFTGARQKYFQYAGLLAPGATSVPREWRFGVPSTATHFVFSVFVSAAVRGAAVPSAGIVFLAGHNVTDTIDSSQQQMLRIGVRGTNGAPAVNTAVRVDAVRLVSSPFGPEVWTAAPGDAFYGYAANVVTDSQGVVQVWVRTGRRAGPGRLIVTVPDLSLADTARYTILPGRAKEMQSFPQETTVVFGARVQLRYAAYDRHKNARSGDVAALTVTAGPGAVEGNELVAGAALGRVRAIATLAGIQDSSFLRVVPPMRVIGPATPSNSGQTAGLYTFTLDGSDVRRVHSSIAGTGFNSPMMGAWLAPGKFVHQEMTGHRKQLHVLDLAAGASAPFRPAADRMEEEMYPRVSRDGAWVYFSAGTYWNHYLYRVRTDGTGRELVSTYHGGPNEWGADPSPDGARIVYVNDGGGQHGSEELYMMDLSTRNVSRLGLRGVSPRWSPDGTRIAYAGYLDLTYQLMLANGDGTGARVLSTAPVRDELEWSPDGRYIIATTTWVNYLLIIDMVTGTELMVPYTGIDGYLISAVWIP